MSNIFNKRIILITFISIIFIMSSVGTMIVNAQEELSPTDIYGDTEFGEKAKERVEEILIKQQQGESIEETEAERIIRESQEREIQKQTIKLFQEKATEQNKEFVPLQEIPKVIEASTAKEPSLFFNAMFNFGIIIAGFLAVVMIAVGGIQYMSTDAISGKTEGREKITYALLGLLLILFSYILLKTINPDILQFNLFN